MDDAKGLTNLQLELLKIFSFNVNDQQLKEIKSLLAKYFAEKATSEMDALWDEKKWSNDTMDQWSQEHLRTKYED